MKNKLKKITEGYWFYPVTDFVYDEDYVQKYEGYANTSMGEKILEARLDFVKDYNNVLDIGIGSGNFIDNKTNAKGFDVNPCTINKLKSENRWSDPYSDDLSEFNAITFFDSFEHIEKPEVLLNRITTQTVVIALPIFEDYKAILKSKHFRPDEHFHYFTFWGFLYYMTELGFKFQNYSTIECNLGRDAIFTFVFRRYKNNENN